MIYLRVFFCGKGHPQIYTDCMVFFIGHHLWMRKQFFPRFIYSRFSLIHPRSQVGAGFFSYLRYTGMFPPSTAKVKVTFGIILSELVVTVERES